MNTTAASSPLANSFGSVSASDVVAVCAVVVAVLALLATVWQGAIARKHARLSVRPHLDIHETRTSTDRLDICIVNNGLGPAIVGGVRVGWHGQPLAPQDNTYSKRLLARASTFTTDCKYRIFDGESPVLAGQSIALISLTVDLADVSKLGSAMQFLNSFCFEASYRSMYGENFVLRREPK